jgi:hypothetical protein
MRLDFDIGWTLSNSDESPSRVARGMHQTYLLMLHAPLPPFHVVLLYIHASHVFFLVRHPWARGIPWTSVRYRKLSAVRQRWETGGKLLLFSSLAATPRSGRQDHLGSVQIRMTIVYTEMGVGIKMSWRKPCSRSGSFLQCESKSSFLISNCGAFFDIKLREPLCFVCSTGNMLHCFCSQVSACSPGTFLACYEVPLLIRTVPACIVHYCNSTTLQKDHSCANTLYILLLEVLEKRLKHSFIFVIGLTIFSWHMYKSP